MDLDMFRVIVLLIGTLLKFLFKAQLLIGYNMLVKPHYVVQTRWVDVACFVPGDVYLP